MGRWRRHVLNSTGQRFASQTNPGKKIAQVYQSASRPMMSGGQSNAVPRYARNSAVWLADMNAIRVHIREIVTDASQFIPWKSVRRARPHSFTHASIPMDAWRRGDGVRVFSQRRTSAARESRCDAARGGITDAGNVGGVRARRHAGG